MPVTPDAQQKTKGYFTPWLGIFSPADTPLSTAAALEVVGGSDQQTPVGDTFPRPLRVHVTDSTGAPVYGTIVTFSAPLAGASSRLSALGGITDSVGIAEVDATAIWEAGSYTVEAHIGKTGLSKTFTLTNLPARDQDAGADADAGSSDTDASAPDVGARSSASSGCGCSASPNAPSFLGALALLALSSARRRMVAEPCPDASR